MLLLHSSTITTQLACRVSGKRVRIRRDRTPDLFCLSSSLGVSNAKIDEIKKRTVLCTEPKLGGKMYDFQKKGHPYTIQAAINNTLI